MKFFLTNRHLANYRRIVAILLIILTSTSRAMAEDLSPSEVATCLTTYTHMETTGPHLVQGQLSVKIVTTASGQYIGDDQSVITHTVSSNYKATFSQKGNFSITMTETVPLSNTFHLVDYVVKISHLYLFTPFLECEVHHLILVVPGELNQIYLPVIRR